jgi:hypothetical protein
MTEEEFAEGVAAVTAVYRKTAVLTTEGSVRPLRVAPVHIPRDFWGGGTTRLLVVFDPASHGTSRPRGLLGDEWKLAGGGAPAGASSTFEYGEAWQNFSWAFPWPPALSVLATVEAYLGRFNDHR